MFLSLSPDSRTGFFWYGSGGRLHSQFDSNLVRESEIALMVPQITLDTR